MGGFTGNTLHTGDSLFATWAYAHARHAHAHTCTHTHTLHMQERTLETPSFCNDCAGVRRRMVCGQGCGSVEMGKRETLRCSKILHRAATFTITRGKSKLRGGVGGGGRDGVWGGRRLQRSSFSCPSSLSCSCSCFCSFYSNQTNASKQAGRHAWLQLHTHVHI